MRILFIGDIVGSSGRQLIQHCLPQLLAEKRIDFTVANGENSSGGFGINRKCLEELHAAGIDAFTMGNHVWRNKDLLSFIDHDQRIIRPGNLSAKPLPGTYFRYYQVGDAELMLVNMIGRTFMDAAECPFTAMDKLLEQEKGRTPFILLDFHAEATSEKNALGNYLDGRVSACVGTHTHIQTNDARILPRGTGYLTDAGMTGPRDSVLGVEPEIIIRKFIFGFPERFELARGDRQFNGVIFELDAMGKCQNIELVNFWQGAL